MRRGSKLVMSALAFGAILGAASGVGVAGAQVAAVHTASPDGVIAGELGYEGGAYPGKFHPTAGLVRVAGPKLSQTVEVGPTGRFSVVEPPAKYTLVGCGGTDDSQCGPAVHVTVKAGRTVHVKVPWALVP